MIRDNPILRDFKKRKTKNSNNNNNKNNKLLMK